MYRSFPEIWDGFVKNFALGLRGQPVTAGLGSRSSRFFRRSHLLP